jgi:hypothetical protein
MHCKTKCILAHEQRKTIGIVLFAMYGTFSHLVVLPFFTHVTFQIIYIDIESMHNNVHAHVQAL